MAIYASLANNNIYASLSFDIEFPPPPHNFQDTVFYCALQ